MGEKALGEILGIVDGSAAATGERVQRLPVMLAEFLEGPMTVGV